MIPQKIKISRIENYHTHFIGKFDGNKLFFGYNHFVYKPFLNYEDWQNNRHEYIVLYLFNEDGKLYSFKYWYAGVTAKLNCDTHLKLNEFVKSLGEIKFCDIDVETFSIEIDGITFGLIPKIDDDYERIELDPSSTIAFNAPWDGEYDT